MSLWWLEPGWTEALCARCGDKIWPDGDPDWGYCFRCFTDNLRCFTGDFQQQQARQLYDEFPLPERTVMSDSLTEALITEFIKHRRRKPDIPEDYAANVDHLRMQMDEWHKLDAGFRLLIGTRLVDDILDEAEAGGCDE